MDYTRKATGSAAVIRDHQGRVLLVRRAYGPHDWVLPGGIAEQHESPSDTVRREVHEEIGLSVRIDALIGVYYQADHRAGEFIHFVFACTAGRGSRPSPRPSGSRRPRLVRGGFPTTADESVNAPAGD